jgi:sugar phosphate isomerase/epimerase
VKPRYATRLNAFRTAAPAPSPSGRLWPGALGQLAAARRVPGLDGVDFNYPDHLENLSAREVREALDDLGVALNGFAMRYYSEPGFKIGAFTNPDSTVRRRAINLTKRGIDTLLECGGTLMTLWLGQDGFDYSFQVDYAALWDLTLEALAEVADHAREVDVSLEYKPDEPRAFSLMPDLGTTLFALAELGRPNTGVTLDFAHVLYAGEMPAFSAVLAARRSRLLGVNLNDGYGKRDDGLMVGSVHPVQTVELLVALERAGYDGPLYFDTFPDASGLDPVGECAANIAAVEALRRIARRLAGSPELVEAMRRQDAVASQRIVQAALFAG